MGDNISRQAAIDAIDCNIVVTGRENAETVAATIGTFVDRIKALPSTDRKGEWKEDETGNGFWICSSCGFVSEASGAWLLYKYCPHCGADMRGEQNE